MPTLLSLVSRYRWELMLFVGVPIVENVMALVIFEVPGAFGVVLLTLLAFPHLILLMSPTLLLLGFSYLYVRRLGRPLLSLAWAYAIAFVATDVAINLLSGLADSELWSIGPGLWWRMGATILVPVIVLVWFARQASRISFKHALSLIALSTALVSSVLIFPHPLSGTFGRGWLVAWGIAVLTTVLKLFAVWVLSRLDAAKDTYRTDAEHSVSRDIFPLSGLLNLFTTRVLSRLDPTRGRYKEAIIALLGLSWLLRAASDLRSLLVVGQELTHVIAFMAFQLVYWAVWFALIIALGYGVRVRQPTERPPAPVSTPTS